ESSKEIRIAMKKNQVMKEHKTPFPIVVEIFEGKVDFGVNGVIHNLEKGDLVALEGNVPHDLLAMEDSIVRLSLSIADTVGRVEGVANNS
ncbi:MAG: cupin, partial [Bacteroidota bacterium]